MNNHDDNRNHDKDVDESTSDVDHEETQQPENQQYRGDDEQHLSPFLQPADFACGQY
jgi:hypothetical protein